MIQNIPLQNACFAMALIIMCYMHSCGFCRSAKITAHFSLQLTFTAVGE